MLVGVLGLAGWQGMQGEGVGGVLVSGLGLQLQLEWSGGDF